MAIARSVSTLPSAGLLTCDNGRPRLDRLAHREFRPGRHRSAVDTSWFMPAAGHEAAARSFSSRTFQRLASSTSTRLPTRRNPAPHMLPTAEAFGRGNGGRSKSTARTGSSSTTIQPDADRCAWLVHVAPFRRRTASGSSTAASRSGSPKDGRPKAASPAKTGAFRSHRARGRNRQLRAGSSGSGSALVDARGRGRFDGTEPDPRPGVASGHVPGARNLPFTELYNPDGTLKPRDVKFAACS